MPAPFPPSIKDKTKQYSQIATEIYFNYEWIARWSDEIVNDPDINLKKLAQLGFHHCRVFPTLLASPSPELWWAVQQRMLLEGIKWSTISSMQEDLNVISVACVAFKQWVITNMPEASTAMEERQLDTEGRETMVAKVLPKPHPVINEVTKLRATFTR